MSELPKGWVTLSTGDAGVWRGGGTPSKANSEFWTSGTIPWVSPKDMKRSHIAEAIDNITERAIENSATQLIPEGSVLVVTRSGILRHSLPVAANTAPVAINQDLKALTPYDGIEPEYVMLQLQADASEILQECAKAGTTVDSIDFGRLKQRDFRLAPLAEQRRIVAKVDGLTARTDRARKELDRVPILIAHYKQRLLALAFSGKLTAGWRRNRSLSEAYEPSTVDAIAEITTGFTPPTKGKDRYFGGNIPFFKPTDLDAGYHVRYPRETLTGEGANRGRRVPAGSTLVTCIGATIGKTGFARVECCTNQQINALVPNLERVQAEWLFWAVVSPDFQRAIIDNSSATTLPIINKGRFKKLELSVPPLDEQAEIVRRIESAFDWLDRVANEHSSAEKLLAKLDGAILTKAFRGELVPQDPNDEPASALLERISEDRASSKSVKTSSKRNRKTRTQAPRKAKVTMTKSRHDEDVWQKPYLTGLLKQSNSVTSPEELFSRSDLQLVDFYHQLSTEYENGWLVEVDGQVKAA